MAEQLKLPEVARRLEVSEKTARRYVKSGALPSIFVGGAYRVSEEDLEGFLQGAKVTPSGGSPKAPVSSQPSFNGLLEEERRTVWETAVDAARRLRGTGWARMEEALSGWRASKGRREPYAARREYLDEMGTILEEAYDADAALGWAYIEAAWLAQGGSEARVPSYLRKESWAATRFYGQLLGLVQSEKLSVHTGDEAAAAKQEDAAEGAQPKPRPHSVEEPEAA